MTTKPKPIPDPEPDPESEILRRLWSLVAERNALQDRWEVMTRAVPEHDATDEARAGLAYLDAAVRAGLLENRDLIREGLHALGVYLEDRKGDVDAEPEG